MQQRLLWAIINEPVAAVLRTVGTLGGCNLLPPLQMVTVTCELPFRLIDVIMYFALYKGLNEEELPKRFPKAKRA